MNNLLENVKENALFVAQVLGIVLVLFLIALLVEKIAQKRSGSREKIFSTRKVAMIGMFSALAMILMLFEFPLFFAPPFYELDFSEIPILIGSFAFGPAAGVMMEFVKILLKLCIKGTSTAFIGDLANFAVGCSFILPASITYSFFKKKKGAIAGCIIGTLILTVFGTAFNAIYLLPAFSKFYGMPLDVILKMGSDVNPLMTEGSIVSFVICCVAPMNLIKGTAASVVTMLVYKKLSPIIKGSI
ncbi:MAG: ECF transporter S component [Lachnospiraceae bacterium]|nr:ECF transporter S component [Lachnospiraceae bacterium]